MRAKLCFLVTSNIIVSYIFPENLIEIYQVSQKIWVFTSSIFTIFFNFLNVFIFTCYKTTNGVSIYKKILVVFWIRINLDKLFKNYIKL